MYIEDSKWHNTSHIEILICWYSSGLYQLLHVHVTDGNGLSCGAITILSEVKSFKTQALINLRLCSLAFALKLVSAKQRNSILITHFNFHGSHFLVRMCTLINLTVFY